MQVIWKDKLAIYGSDSERREWDIPATATGMLEHYQIGNHFIECILHGKQPLVTVEDAIRAQEIAVKMVKNIH